MEPSNTLNRKRTSPFRYGFGMLGTSIPINMLKSYAAAYYVLKLGLITTDQMAKILFITPLSMPSITPSTASFRTERIPSGASADRGSLSALR